MTLQADAPRQFGADTYLGLKAVWRDLVHKAGGAVRAAGLTRGNQSRISEAMSPQLIDRFPALDQIADLESECGDPIVTRYLAQMAGFDLIPITASGSQKSIYTENAETVSAVGQLEQMFAAAVTDGMIKPVEADAVIKAIEKTVSELHELKATVCAAVQKPTPKLRAAT